MSSHGGATLAFDNISQQNSTTLDGPPRGFSFVSGGLAEADKGRSPAARLSVGLILCLVSIGLVATATIAVFFGVAFLLLLQPAGETFPGAGAPNSVVQIEPLVRGLWLSSDSSERPTADKSESVAFSPSMAGSNAATLASSMVPVAAGLAAADALPLQADDAAGTNNAARTSVSPLVPETVARAEITPSGGGLPPVTSMRGTAADSAAPPDPAPVSLAAPIDPGLSAADIANLLDHGDALLRIGDIASARLFYERAAVAGNGRAALHLGASFDPVFLSRAGFGKMQADVAQAYFWYSRAADLGAAEAKRRLNPVDSKHGR